MADDGVGDDAEGADEGENPEEGGEFGFASAGGVPILIDEAECEDDLPCRAEE